MSTAKTKPKRKYKPRAKKVAPVIKAAPLITKHEDRPNAPYRVTLNLINGFYEAEGSTIPVAIAGMKVKNIRGKGTIKVQNGSKKAEIVMFLPQLRRLFGNQTAAVFFEKRILTIMK